jgi:ABC-type nickel/cobalt efflux system permease component RcnA
VSGILPGSLGALCGAAAGIGFLHTVIGVDHYVPFIALGRARRWTLQRTLAVTALCGLGHVAGSLLLGSIGLGLGLALGRLQAVEARRGDLANWILIGFGLAYAVWGIWRAQRDRAHEHLHQHADGTRHSHPHHHRAGHAHPHLDPARQATVVWTLFIVFAFGPCEALIPLLAAAASAGGPAAAGLVSLPFAAATIATMLGAVALGRAGAKLAVPAAAERYAHALAGLALTASGLAVRYLGL